MVSELRLSGISESAQRNQRKRNHFGENQISTLGQKDQKLHQDFHPQVGQYETLREKRRESRSQEVRIDFGPVFEVPGIYLEGNG